jgi:transposase
MISIKDQADIRRKLKVLNYVKSNGNFSKTRKHFGISREPFYKWKRDYEANGESTLINSKL